MKVLVLGGTGFVGKHLVRSLQRHGHAVTLFNRGKTSPDCFPELETILGDREVSHDGLRGRTFDAVIDTNGRRPAVVREAATLLQDRVGHYSFISSISAYAAFSGGDQLQTIDENAPLADLPPDQYDDCTASTYGGRKAACERMILDELGGKALIIRPGLVVGPEDSTDRFTYWPVRFAEGGKILAPGTGEDPVRLIDARDLADWMTMLIERAENATFNAVGPEISLTMKDLLSACAAASGTVSETVWASEDFLIQHGVKAWTDMPVWAPGFASIDISRPLGAGLKFRPIIDTARDTLIWSREVGLKRPMQAGLTPDHEAKLLQAWLNG